MTVDYAALKAGGFMRQKQKDTFSLRLRVVGGTLTVEQLQTIAAAAEKYGKNYVHLTSRQGVEIPFIRLEDIENIKKDLAAGGVSPSVCGPRVRTVTACQGGQCCPSGCIDTLAIATELDRRYFGRKLPHKFKLGVTGCPNNCLKAEENDMGVKGGMSIQWKAEQCTLCGVCAKSCRRGAIELKDGKIVLDEQKCKHCGRCVKVCPSGAWSGKSGYSVFFGGTFGNTIHRGTELLPLIEDEETLWRIADAAIEYFAQNAQPGERLAQTLERLGWEDFTRKIQEAYHAALPER
ncbi:MAG: 4Fe-4S binding protein [Deltaproteobacteria bacterium]|nr:4Fe-4S binding protein [Deltaproteobacteria bacterium]